MCAERRTRDACGSGGPRQGHHLNAMLLSSVMRACRAWEQMFLKAVCG